MCFSTAMPSKGRPSLGDGGGFAMSSVPKIECIWAAVHGIFAMIVDSRATNGSLLAIEAIWEVVGTEELHDGSSTSVRNKVAPLYPYVSRFL
jgi:hypothetical protein